MSMNSKLQEQFNEQLQYLPEINQKALRSFNWAEELITIGKKHGLPIDALEDLQIETMLVLVGLINPDDYPNELATRLAISPAQVEVILSDVNDKILTPIHNYIINNGEQKSLSEPGFNPMNTAIQTEIPNIQPVYPPETSQETLNPLHSAGIDITTEDIPLMTPEAHLSRIGGIPAFVPETKPTGNPIIFNPEQNTSVVAEPKPILSLQKLQAMNAEKKKIVDMSIDGIDRMTA